jgi:hypothetical protein
LRRARRKPWINQRTRASDCSANSWFKKILYRLKLILCDAKIVRPISVEIGILAIE